MRVMKKKLREWVEIVGAWLKRAALLAIGYLVRFVRDTGVHVIFLGLLAYGTPVCMVVLFFSAGDDGGWIAALMGLQGDKPTALAYLGGACGGSWVLFFKAKEDHRRDSWQREGKSRAWQAASQAALTEEDA